MGMKRLIAACLAAVMALGLTACANKQPAPVSEPSAPESSEPISSEQVTEGKEVAIREACSAEGTFTDEWGNDFDYSYHIPQIDDDTPGAAAINADIRNIFGTLADNMMADMEQNQMPYCMAISYETYRNGDVLSLLIRAESFSYWEYGAYNYDVSSGGQLNNADLLARFDLTAEQAVEQMRRAAVNRLDETYMTNYGDAGMDDWLCDYQERRGWTASAENFDPILPLYIGENGVLSAIVQVGAMAESDWFYEALPLSAPKSKDMTAGYADAMSVKLEDGKLYLKFHDSDSLRDLMREYGCNADPLYEHWVLVQGLYSNYTEIFCGTIERWNSLYVFLLTETGRVEYVDVFPCMSGNYYCASAPIVGLNEVQDFEEGQDANGLKTMYAVRTDGSKVDLGECILEQGQNVSWIFCGDWTAYVTYNLDDGGSYENFYSLQLHGDSSFELQSSVFDVGINLYEQGVLLYLGATADGAVYTYRLWDADDTDMSIRYGAISLTTENDMDARTLYVTELGGDGFIDTRVHAVTELSETFG